MKLSRKQFLVSGALGLGAAGSAASMINPSIYTDDYPLVEENYVKLPANGKTVVIIGGGLTGLITAGDLLDKGFKVTILEKNNSLGGKLRSWREKNFADKPKGIVDWRGYPIEHGTHIVPSFYNNFRELLRRRNLKVRKRYANASDGKSPDYGFSFVYPDGIIDDRPISKAPAPFFAKPFVQNLKRLTEEENDKTGYYQMMKMMAYDPTDIEETFYLDSISLKDYCLQIGYDKKFVSQFLDPILDMANFWPSDRSSALYFHRFTTAIFGHWKDLQGFSFFDDDTDSTIIQPLRKYMEKMGGKIEFNTEIENIVIENDKVKELVSKELKGTFWICPVCGEIHEQLEMPKVCKRCGYRGTDFYKQSSVARKFTADYYIMGTDIPGMQKLFNKEPFNKKSYFKKSADLEVSNLINVFMWYPRLPEKKGEKRNWKDFFGDREAIFTADFPLLATMLNVTLMKPDSFKGLDGDLLEIQIARVERCKNMSDKEIADALHKDLKSLIPGLPDYKDFITIRWDNFSVMGIGTEQKRPGMVSPYKNLLVLGDYIYQPHNSFLMERVTINSKMATNYLLNELGEEKGKMKILEFGTPIWPLKLLKKVISVKA